ncbi:MAG: penicillin-binding protein activator [Gallionella sp.]
MQRVLLFVFVWFALYASALAQSLALPVEKPTQPAIKFVLTPSPVAAKPPEAVSAEKPPARHIALLLPVKSVTFGAAADAVRQGILAAASIEKQALPIRVYDNFDEDKNVVAIYQQAIAEGAGAVIGPLTRNGTLTLSALKDFPVPTLSLNVIDNTLADNLYFFGLAIEMEARQIAHTMKQKGVKQAIIVTTRAPLSKRLQAAFEDTWSSGGGKILREMEYNDDPAIFSDMADTPDTAVFLATDADKARLIRPYLMVRPEAPVSIVSSEPVTDATTVLAPKQPAAKKLPIYATSRVFVGNDNSLANFDLSDLVFVDMPWLLQTDHLAVMTYPRVVAPLSIDNERLYALGIDAFRLTQLLLNNTVAPALPLDGVSGQIQLRGHTFQRTATQAVFSQGRAQLSDAPIIRNADFPYAPSTPHE